MRRNWLVKILNDLQAVQLDILKEFSRIAEREELKWFAVFGTLLGASRNCGFIPWDDDIDVAMPREEYNRLRTMPDLFEEPYFLQTTQNDPTAAPRYMRLMRNDTAYLSDFPDRFLRGGHMGIYIDIIPLDIVPDTIAAQRIQGAAHMIHSQMCACAAFGDNTSRDVPDVVEQYAYAGAGLPGHYNLFADYYEKMCSSFTSGHYYAMPVLLSERGTRVYDREWFRECIFMNFEGLKIPAPIGWKETLIVSYPEGLYEREEKYRYDLTPDTDILIDTNRSYLEYTRRYTDALIGISDKKVFIFGAGDSLRVWLNRFGKGLNIICAFDNAQAKWGKSAYGIPVRSPKEIPKLLDENSRLIIVSLYHKEISEQLNKMGISDYYIYIDGWYYEKG